jgi:hypothetical protein
MISWLERKDPIGLGIDGGNIEQPHASVFYSRRRGNVGEHHDVAFQLPAVAAKACPSQILPDIGQMLQSVLLVV